MLSAKDIMSADPVTVAPDMDIIEATKLMLEYKFNGLPVVDDAGKLVGVLCQSDLVAQQKKVNLPSLFTILDGFIPLKSLSDMDSEMRKVAATRVSDAMTDNPATVTPDTPLDEVATLMVDSKYYTLPVVKDGILVGVVGKEDVLRTLVGV
ncbi:CBS domain containing membrane protein [Oleidesulfovibrio alaskensis G20]|jgi:CBS domain-containing protein|uniref:CBS domain containing membrane protein n=1 Tax=Oleidesulfovibrio alaskensis (strain ATCC BAA-1058 / DSM 17464 / G20) TaxID=207559 RepID=Q30ZQ3_OLEA2|nr:CBS domain-containing protein [Oleidesulfovibrio alaskensis]ABB38843.1 CBS domain containing membrane protein [Oleidesulfovibrio alaskensis G20]MBG0772366.1 CBS domain-containing protein [Oleidesulfovibrio alaskensis]MBL3582718.1 CBS domain-containing protein [Oleidesulfovibrio alaskensis]